MSNSEGLGEVLEELKRINTRLDKIELKIDKIAKYVPFVDNLANSGAVSAVTSLNTLFSKVNPMNLIRSESSKEQLEDVHGSEDIFCGK